MYLRTWEKTVIESKPINIERIQRDRLFSAVQVGGNGVGGMRKKYVCSEL